MKSIVEKLIKDYITQYPVLEKTETGWNEPIVAYASANDPMFQELKEIIGPNHGLPTDFLPTAKTVIAYFIPLEESIIESNINERVASRPWGVSYVETNRLISNLNNYMKSKLEELGYSTSVTPAALHFDTKRLITDWSHRHVAYVAGLGKFGLNNMLITEKGCCGRVGTIITELELTPTIREEEEYCLYKRNGSCGVCTLRCVNEALFKEVFHRHKCYEMCLMNADRLLDIGNADVCGKCLVKVPCTYQNPSKNK